MTATEFPYGSEEAFRAVEVIAGQWQVAALADEVDNDLYETKLVELVLASDIAGITIEDFMRSHGMTEDDIAALNEAVEARCDAIYALKRLPAKYK